MIFKNLLDFDFIIYYLFYVILNFTDYLIKIASLQN